LCTLPPITTAIHPSITICSFIILLGVSLIGITYGFTGFKIPTQYRRTTASSITRIFGGDNDQTSTTIKQINKEEMADIISLLERGENGDSFVVIDVRGQDEIMMGTGLCQKKLIYYHFQN